MSGNKFTTKSQTLILFYQLFGWVCYKSVYVRGWVIFGKLPRDGDILITTVKLNGIT